MNNYFGPAVVLYTHDMEPITVLPLPPVAQRYLLEQGRVRLAVMPPLQTAPLFADDPIALSEYRMQTVDITAERFVRGRKSHLMLFTRDEEQALLLKSAFLPGQQRALQAIRNDHFAKGFLHALQALGT